MAQGANPSTEDLLKAINQIPARDLVLLPNHKDVVGTAVQAARLQTEKRLHVVPTVNMPQGISALIALGDATDKNIDFEATIAAMESACATVTTIQITRATRAARLNSLDIQEGDFIAIIDGVICSAATDIKGVLVEALAILGTDDKELATLYSGAGFDTAAANDLIQHLLQTVDHIEFEAVYGGQSLYPLLVSLE